MKKENSSVFQFLEMLWRHTAGATAHSWDRLNRCMNAGLHLAIDAGMKFEQCDFADIAERFDMGYWGRMDGGGGFAEEFYRNACMTQNLTAARSFERWKGRPAFIVDGAIPSHEWRREASRAWRRKRGRVAVGFSFWWKGQDVRVTSFAEDGGHLNACSYHPKTKGNPYSRSRIKNRFRITIADIRAQRKAATACK